MRLGEISCGQLALQIQNRGQAMRRTTKTLGLALGLALVGCTSNEPSLAEVLNDFEPPDDTRCLAFYISGSDSREAIDNIWDDLGDGTIPIAGEAWGGEDRVFEDNDENRQAMADFVDRHCIDGEAR